MGTSRDVGKARPAEAKRSSCRRFKLGSWCPIIVGEDDEGLGGEDKHNKGKIEVKSHKPEDKGKLEKEEKQEDKGKPENIGKSEKKDKSEKKNSSANKGKSKK